MFFVIEAKDKAIGIGKCAERAVTISPCGESQFLTQELLQTSELLAGYTELLSGESLPDSSDSILRSRIEYIVVLLKAQSRHLRRIVEDVREG